MIYYIDWFRATCSNCGADFEFPLSDFDNYGLSIKLAFLIHDRETNNYRKCNNINLRISLIHKMDVVEL